MSPWAALGIKRTDDVAEIRRAYARKLKATDVDGDPAAFIALRAAFERALGEVEAGRQRQASIVAEVGDAPSPPAAIAAAAAGESPPAPGPAAPQASEPVGAPVTAGSDAAEAASGIAPEAAAGESDDARYIALDALLFPGEGAPPPDPDALAAAVRAVLDHPEMDQIDRSANVEFWLARLLYDAAPNSDPVLPMVIEHFHWERKAGHWDQPPLFEALLQRRNAFRLLDQLAYRGHPLHAAWRDLTSDKPTIGLTPIGRRSDVASLLYKIRAEAPPAEAYLNPHRVALWEGYVTNTGGGGVGLNWIWLGVIALVSLAKLGSAINHPSTPPPIPIAASAYADPNLDIDPFVQDASQNSLHFADLDSRNPGLHDRLLDRWNQASDRHDSRFLFSSDVRTIIERAIGEGLRGGSYALQADYWRLRADELRWLRGADVESCGHSIRGEALSRSLPVEFSDRSRAIQARVLGETPHDPPPPLPPGAQVSYSIPGPVVEDARRRSGLSESVLRGTFHGRGTSAQLCTARIAFLDAALAVPERRGARLIRAMSAGF